MRSSKRITALAMTALFTLGMAGTAFAGTWSAGKGENENNWWYDNGDGTYASNGWQWIDGDNDGVAECYYFDTNGWLLTNTVTPDGFNVNANGAWINGNTIETKNVENNQSFNLANLDGEYHLIGGFQLNGEYRDMVPGDMVDSGYYIVSGDTIVSKELWENTDRPIEKYIKSGNKFLDIAAIYPEQYQYYMPEYLEFYFEDDKLIGKTGVDLYEQATEDMILRCVFVN